MVLLKKSKHIHKKTFTGKMLKEPLCPDLYADIFIYSDK